MWVTFANYLDALDQTPSSTDTRGHSWSSGDYARQRRTKDLAEWHNMLLTRLADTEAEALLDRLPQWAKTGDRSRSSNLDDDAKAGSSPTSRPWLPT